MSIEDLDSCFDDIVGSEDFVSSDEIQTFDRMIEEQGLEQETQQSLRRQLQQVNLRSQQIRAQQFDAERRARKLKNLYDELQQERRHLTEAAWPSRLESDPF